MTFVRKLISCLLRQKPTPVIREPDFSAKAHRLHIDNGQMSLWRQDSKLDWIGYPEFEYDDLAGERERLGKILSRDGHSRLVSSYYNKQAAKSAALAKKVIETAMRTTATDGLLAVGSGVVLGKTGISNSRHSRKTAPYDRSRRE